MSIELPLIDCCVKKVIIFDVYAPSSDTDLSSFILFIQAIAYIITNGPSSGLLALCMCYSDHPLNISDHIPLSISLKAAPSESSSVASEAS